MNGLWKMALWLALAPLAIGTIVVLSWTVTGWWWLLIGGLWNISLGSLAMAGAFICLAVYAWQGLARKTVPARRLAWQAGLIMVLAALHLVVCGAVMDAVFLGNGAR